MAYQFDYSVEKDLLVREVRGIGFDDIIDAISQGQLLDNINHFNKKKHPNQRILVVWVKNKVYAVPYVLDKKRKVFFLKTVYPSRKLAVKYNK